MSVGTRTAFCREMALAEERAKRSRMCTPMLAALPHLGSWMAVGTGVIFTPLVLRGIGGLEAPLISKLTLFVFWAGIVAALALSIR